MAKRKSKVTQGYIEGMEPPSIPEIDRAADKYLAARNARMEGLQEEIKLRGALELVMAKHELKQYAYDGKVVQIEAKEKVKVRQEKAEKGDGEDGD